MGNSARRNEDRARDAQLWAIKEIKITLWNGECVNVARAWKTT